MENNNSLENNSNNNLQSNQNSIDIHNFTFKIIKKREPWSNKEDETLFELVKKHGTTNWSLISTELTLKFNSNNRSGKQCRERWHNHLAPNVNKDNWSEEEENVLFTKHMEYGNKWSDIAQYLPGRTDNAIKNHFYSKLRKFIRKILKQIHKENLFKNNDIDSNKYNGEKIYKLLKKYKVTYKNLTKNTILELILVNEKNPKAKFSFNNNKIEDNFNNDRSYLFCEQEDQKGNIINNIGTPSNNINFNINNYTKSNKRMLNNGNFLNNELFDRDIIINVHNEINNIKYLNNLNEKEKKTNTEIRIKNTKKKKLVNVNKNKLNNNQTIGKKRKRNKMSNISCSKKSDKQKNQLDIKNNSSLLNIQNDKTNIKKINKTNSSIEENTFENIRDGLQIHPNREIIVIAKKLLTEDLFPNNNYHYKPKVKISIPNTPRIYQISSPSLLGGPVSNKGIFNINFGQINDDNKNYQVNDFLEQSQISPIGFDNNFIGYPQSTKNIYNPDLANEINFFKKGNSLMGSSKNDGSLSNLNYGLYNFMSPTPNREIHLFNKINISNNIDNQINNDKSIMQSMNNSVFNNPFKNNKKKEMPTINLDLINHTGFNNSFCGNDSQSVTNKNNTSNLYNLSNYSPINVFIPKNSGNE